MQVANAIRNAAASGLGYVPTDPPASLMRSVERKMIIGRQWQLALMVHFMVHRWEAARDDNEAY